MKAVKILCAALCSMIFLSAPCAFSEEQPKATPAELFQRANAYYEKSEYPKAVEEYRAILDQGLESGSLDFNLGNAYFKLGELGKAVLYYEKAKMLIPQDADLKSNLEYAQSLSEEPAASDGRLWWTKFLEDLTGFLSIGDLTNAVSGCYFLIACLIALHIAYRGRMRKTRAFSIIVAALAFITIGASWAARVYERESLKPAIVIAKEESGRFEPVDTSTVYFKVYAGNKVLVVSTKDNWSKVKRLDGKTAWIKNDTISLI